MNTIFTAGGSGQTTITTTTAAKKTTTRQRIGNVLYSDHIKIKKKEKREKISCWCCVGLAAYQPPVVAGLCRCWPRSTHAFVYYHSCSSRWHRLSSKSAVTVIIIVFSQVLRRFYHWSDGNNQSPPPPRFTSAFGGPFLFLARLALDLMEHVKIQMTRLYSGSARTFDSIAQQLSPMGERPSFLFPPLLQPKIFSFSWLFFLVSTDDGSKSWRRQSIPQERERERRKKAPKWN